MRKTVFMILLPSIALGVAYFLYAPKNQDPKYVHQFVKPGLQLAHRVEHEIKVKSKGMLSVRFGTLRMGYAKDGVLRMCGKVGLAGDINNDATWRTFMGEIAPNGTSFFEIEDMQSPGSLLVVCRSRGL